MKIMIQKMYENDRAMFEKMNMKESDIFLLVNRLKQDKVHLNKKNKINLKKTTNLNFNYCLYLEQDIKQFYLFVINGNVLSKVL
jgi:hypothetical protein